MSDRVQRAKEQEVIKAFINLCVPSVEPDSYTFLVEKIIPLLREARGLLDYDLVVNQEGKLYLRTEDSDQVLRQLTDAEDADYIWGTDGKPKFGMYGETPCIQIGRIAIREFSDPAGDEVWIEDSDPDSGVEDGGSFKKESLGKALKEFYDNNF